MEEPINIGTGTDIAIAEPIGFEGRFVFDPAKLDGNPRKLLKVSIQCYRLCQYKKSGTQSEPTGVARPDGDRPAMLFWDLISTNWSSVGPQIALGPAAITPRQ